MPLRIRLPNGPCFGQPHIYIHIYIFIHTPYITSQQNVAQAKSTSQSSAYRRTTYQHVRIGNAPNQHVTFIINTNQNKVTFCVGR